MVKGVNKKVIEINRPDSAYFERAVLYLRPEVTEVPLGAAQHEAESYFDSLGRRQSGRRLHRAAWFLLGMLTSGGAALLCLLVLH